MRKKKPVRSEERRARRVQPLPTVYFSTDDVVGQGGLGDLSTKGVRIEHASPRLDAGTRCELVLTLRDDWPQIHVEGDVARQTDSGFAVQFVEVDATVDQMLSTMVSEIGSLGKSGSGPGRALPVFRVSLRSSDAGRHRTLKVAAENAESAREQAIEGVGEGWEVEDVQTT
jgi:hypothetical protein